MRVTLFDYGAGNLHSLAKALAEGGDRIRLTTDPVRALDTDVLVLPGVGAFAPAAARLAPARARMRDAIRAGLPCLGVCLGMQLLFESSAEGEGRGLGVFEGAVTRLDAARVPHMGWNRVEPSRVSNDAAPVGAAPDPLLRCAPPEIAYFAHGYACRPADPSIVAAWCTHEGDRFAAVVRRDATMGVQFHPEKSSRAGVAMLAAFLDAVTLQPGAPPCS